MALASIPLYYAELEQLLEYSATRPTGTTTGKVWRRYHPFDGWLIGMYGPDEDPEYVRTYWFQVELFEGPLPGAARAPDWFTCWRVLVRDKRI